MLTKETANQDKQNKMTYFNSVRKRDGSIAPFDKSKITDAIYKAAISVGGEDRIMAEELASAAALFLRKKFGSVTPSIEEIQDIVEKVLIETGHAKTAKAYILYRERRAQARRTLRVRKPITPTGDTTDMSLLVTPMAKDEIVPWDKSKITYALVKEAGLDSELAAEIASAVERKIIASGHRQISTTLIRELVDNELFERGLSTKLKKQAIIGMPTYDLDNLILTKSNENSNISANNPEAVNLSIAETTLKQYVLQRIFSEDIATAHMKGMIHIHDLGYPRVYCSSHSLEYIKKYGLKLGGLDTQSAPAKYARTLTGHLNTFLACMQAYYAGALGVAYINIMYAPYLEGMSDDKLRQEAQYLIFSASQNAFSRGGQSLFTDYNVHTGVPNYLKKIPAIGPKGEYTGKTYADYEKTTQRFARTMLDVWRAGDKNGKPFAFPKCIDKDTKLFARINGKLDIYTAEEIHHAMIGSYHTDIRVPNFNLQTKTLQWDKLRTSANRGEEIGIAVSLPNNIIFRTTADHPHIILTKNGLETKEASELRIGDVLLYRRPSDDISPDEEMTKIEVFDILKEDLPVGDGWKIKRHDHVCRSTLVRLPHPIILEHFIPMPVKKIEEVCVDAYAFEVDNSQHTFITADGIFTHNCDFHISGDTFKAPAQRELLEYACQVASENGAPYFVFDRDEDGVTLSACCRLRTQIKDNYMIEHPESLRFSFPRYESVIIKENNIIKTISFEKLFNMINSPEQHEQGFEAKYCNDIKVWDAEGWVDLMRVVKHKKGNKRLRTIFTLTGHCVTTTADHPIPCNLEHSDFICSNCGSSGLFRNGNAKYGATIFCCSNCRTYKAARIGVLDLELRDAINIPDNALLNYAGYPIVDYKYVPKIKTKWGHGFVTPGIAYLLGFYIGDGTIVGNAVHLSLGEKELKAISVLLDSGGLKYSIYSDRKSQKLAVRDATLVKFIKDKMMDGSSLSKQLPADIMHWEESLVRYLIGGVIDTDGFIHRKSIEIVNSSKAVLSQIQMLLHAKGFYSSLSYRKEDLTSNRYNGYDIKQRNAYFLLRIPCTKQLKAWLSCSFKTRGAKAISNYMLNKEKRGLGCYVKKNSETFSENEEWVYDITTSSGTLSLNGIQVHNCGFQNVTINLPQAAYRAGKGNIDRLFKEIDHCIDLAIKAHLQKKEFISRLMAEPGLPLWEIGKTAHDGRPYVDLNIATYIIGIIGLNECVQFLTGKQLHEDEGVYKLGLRIISTMFLKAKQAEKKLGLRFSLEESPAESAARRLAKVDLRNYPEAEIVIKGDIDNDTYYYTNSIHFTADAPIDLITRIQRQSKFHTMIESGAIIHAFVGEKLPSAKSITNLIEKTYYNTRAAQITISPEFTICNDCNKVELGLKDNCTSCGSENIYGITRIVGYYSKINNWNKSKLGELADRRKHPDNYRVNEATT